VEKRDSRRQRSSRRNSVALDIAKAESGRETWRIVGNGKERTVTTSTTSAAVMDRAVLFFKPALKRLADK